MALIKCKECGHMVSDKAAVCPSCGVELNTKLKPKKKSSKLGVLTVIVLFFILCMVLAQKNPPSPPLTPEQRNARIQARLDEQENSFCTDKTKAYLAAPALMRERLREMRRQNRTNVFSDEFKSISRNVANDVLPHPDCTFEIMGYLETRYRDGNLSRALYTTKIQYIRGSNGNSYRLLDLKIE